MLDAPKISLYTKVRAACSLQSDICLSWLQEKESYASHLKCQLHVLISSLSNSIVIIDGRE